MSKCHGTPFLISYSNLHSCECLTMKKIQQNTTQGWIQHDLVGGGGGCSASSGAELCRSCVPPAHQLASLLQSVA